tara:strand:- start:3310 stop:4056 length:747 start_codon:yes stop_codon:yes gene_type:complete
MTGEYPVPPESIAGREVITWSKVETTLEQGEVRYFISDESKLRELRNWQENVSVRRAAEAMAAQMDLHGLRKLYNGKSPGNETNATAVWDGTATATQIANDLAASIGKIVANSKLPDTKLNNFVCIIPAAAWTGVTQLGTINNTAIRLDDFVNQSYGVKFIPTRQNVFNSKTAALVLPMQDEDTAFLGRFRGTREFPGSESQRIPNRGTEYFIRQWWKCRVMPEPAGAVSDLVDATSTRIAEITGVLA